MEQNNNVNNSNIKGLIFMNIILIILVVGLVGFIVYDKVILDKNDNNVDTTINTPTEDNKEENKKEETEEQKEEEKEEETKLIDSNVLYNNVSSMINCFIPSVLGPYSIKFNHNYMTDIVAQSELVVSALVADKSIQKEYDVDAYGEEASGYVSFNKTDFSNMYINIIGISPDYNQIASTTNGQIKVNNDKVSGVVVTGAHSYDVKYNDVTYSDGVFTVKIDYTAEGISAIIEIKLSINPNDTYKFNSLKVINK